MDQDKILLESLGFKVIRISKDSYSELSRALVEKHGERVNVDIWYNGNKEMTSDQKHMNYFNPVTAYYSRTATYKTLEGFAKGFDKKYKI